MEYRKLLIVVFFVIFSAQGTGPSFFAPEQQVPAALEVPQLQRNRTVDGLFPGQGMQDQNIQAKKAAVVVAAVVAQKKQQNQQPAQEGSLSVVN